MIVLEVAWTWMVPEVHGHDSVEVMEWIVLSTMDMTKEPQ